MESLTPLRKRVKLADIAKHISLEMHNCFDYCSYKFYITKPSGQFHKTFFQHNLLCHRCIALSFDSEYAARGVNYLQKSFIKLAADSFTIFYNCN
jgi:hypothetical protein